VHPEAKSVLVSRCAQNDSCARCYAYLRREAQDAMIDNEIALAPGLTRALGAKTSFEVKIRIAQASWRAYV